MKRFFTLILGVALIASMHSCRTIEENNGQIVEKKLKITAVIDGKMETRVSYDVDNEANTITPAWEVDDEVFGFDGNNSTFTLKVTELIPGGAILEPVGSYTPAEGTAVYAIFAPGYSVNDLSDNTLAVNLAEQGGVLNASTPALMCATGSVKADNELELHFSNQTAIIGVKKFQLNGATAAGSVTSMTVNGVITTGTFQVNEGVLELVPGSETGSITASNATGWATDESGICTAGVYFAAMPTSEAPEITLNAVADGIKYVNVSAITASAMEPGKYYYMSKKLGGAVADVDGVPYLTIDEAWAVANAATAPCTVTLLADCAANKQLNLRNIEGAGSVILDLGEYTLTTMNSTGTTPGMYINSSRNLTITGSSTGKITNSSSTTYPIANYGECTILGGTVESTNYRALYNGSDGNMTIGGTASIKGNTYGIYFYSGTLNVSDNPTIYASYTDGSSNGNSALYIASVSDVTQTINIAGGTFHFDGNTIRCNGTNCTINITGGNFSNMEEGMSKVSAAVYANKGIINISGGYFNSRSIDPAGCSSSGTINAYGGYFNKPIQPTFAKDASNNEYLNVLNTDSSSSDTYPFTLSPASSTPKVAQVSQSTYDWYHGSIESAFICADQRAVSNGQATLTLLDDANASTTSSISSGNTYNVVLDLNGHTISSTTSPVISTASDLIINDLGAGGELTTTGTIALNIINGTTTINSGSIHASTTAISVSNGSLAIYDGHFYGGDTEDIANVSGTITISGGWYRNTPDAEWIAEGYSTQIGEEVFHSRSYTNHVCASTVVATVNGQNYGSWSSAVAAACSYSGESSDIFVQLLDDVDTDTAIDLEHSSKPITLDLNGHTINVSVAAFLNCHNELTIIDNGSQKGKIISSEINVINKVGTGTINLDGCVIASTATGTWSSAGVVRLNNSSSKVNILAGTRIYSTRGLTGLINLGGKVTITGAEISSGTESPGLPAICTGSTISNTTINSGSFYTSATSRAVLVSAAGLASTTQAGPVTINGGYFYASSDATYCLKGNYSSGDHYSKITVNGGYFNKTILWSNKYPTMGEGKSEQSCSVNHIHETTAEEYTYTYMVATTPEP